jgi:hypothetical protein
MIQGPPRNKVIAYLSNIKNPTASRNTRVRSLPLSSRPMAQAESRVRTVVSSCRTAAAGPSASNNGDLAPSRPLLFFFLIDMWSICFLEGFDCGDRHRAALQAVHLGPGLDLKTVFRSGGMPSKMISHSLHRLLFLVFS